MKNMKKIIKEIIKKDEVGQNQPWEDLHTLTVFMTEGVSPSTKSQAAKSRLCGSHPRKRLTPRTQQEQLSRAAAL